MDIYRVKRTGPPAYGIRAAGSSGGKSAGSFQQQLGTHLKEEYRSRVSALFDEITREASNILEHVDILKFEKYRSLIGELLEEVVKNAYFLCSERVLDYSGKQRIYATVSIIDQKLADMAGDLLGRNSERLGYLSRVDEIRGLIMDLLL